MERGDSNNWFICFSISCGSCVASQAGARGKVTSNGPPTAHPVVTWRHLVDSFFRKPDPVWCLIFYSHVTLSAVNTGISFENLSAFQLPLFPVACNSTRCNQNFLQIVLPSGSGYSNFRFYWSKMYPHFATLAPLEMFSTSFTIMKKWLCVGEHTNSS